MARRPKSTRVQTDTPIVPTLIEFLLDETGSMNSIKSATINGFNEYLSEQRAQPGGCLFSLTKFDTNGLKTPYTDLDISMVPNMTNETFNPSAMTNLRDAMMTRIEAVSARIAKCAQKPNVLFVVMTDGGDNASRATVPTTRHAVESWSEQEWTFVYLGADQNALSIASTLGFQPGNVKSFASAEMRDTMQTLATATTAYRAARYSGEEKGATKQFFG